MAVKKSAPVKKATTAKKSAPAKRAAPTKRATTKRSEPKMAAPQVNRTRNTSNAEVAPESTEPVNASPVQVAGPANTPGVQVPSREPVSADDLMQERVTRVAKEVLAGQWNNETGRDERLLAAGHDPEKVKAEIARLKAAQ